MDDHAIEARIAAIEVLLFSLIMQLDAAGFKADYREQKERMLTGLLNNPTVSDKMHDIVEARLRMYERYLGIQD
jgi:hypothetical protein